MMTLRDFYNATFKSHSDDCVSETLYIRNNGNALLTKVTYENITNEINLDDWCVKNISADIDEDYDGSQVYYILDLVHRYEETESPAPVSKVEKTEKHFNNVTAYLGGVNIQHLRLTDEQLRLFDYLSTNQVDISREEKEIEFKEI